MEFLSHGFKHSSQNASSLKFSKHDQHVMSLCLTYKVNLGLSLRKTAQALKDIHGIASHTSKLPTIAKPPLSA